MINGVTSINNETIINMDCLQVVEKINLTELDSAEIAQDNPLWCFDSRIKRNISRVLLTGGFSAAGGYLSGFLPTPAGIIVGSALSGIGNGASTWLSCEKKRELLIRARILHDFPKLVSKINSISEKLFCLIKALDLTDDQLCHTETGSLTIDELSSKEEQNQPFYRQAKNQRNFLRIFIAGALSGAGGWLGGFESSIGGIIGGGTLSGLGNVCSTWLAFEQTHDATIRKNALETLPELLKIIEEQEKLLVDLIERVKALNPELLIHFESNVLPGLTLKESDEKSTCCLTSTRARRNFIYVNAAGWLSVAGVLIAGFVPNTPGILAGGTTSAAANSISTWLAWEKPTDKKVEKVVLEDFPQLILKVKEVSQQILKVLAFADDYQTKHLTI